MDPARERMIPSSAICSTGVVSMRVGEGKLRSISGHGVVDAFEMVVRAVLGQQVTVAGARTLARRFVDRFGEPVNG